MLASYLVLIMQDLNVLHFTNAVSNKCDVGNLLYRTSQSI